MMDTIHKRHHQGYPRHREVTPFPGTYLDFDDVNAPYGHLLEEGCLAPSRYGQSLRDYFSQFGEVLECTVMRDGATGRSRGFGFLTFKDPKTVNIVMVKEHHLDGKIIDPKRAIPRDEQERTSKIFVGGVSQETTDQEFKEYFAQFGRVVDATLMMDKDTGRPRGFGFVTFESDAGVDACLSTDLEIHGKPIEVKKAQPRGNLREEEDSGRRGGPMNKFGRKGPGGGYDDHNGGGNQHMGGGGAAGGMTPQVMAQYWQRMQQYFVVMQQQMAMNRGGPGGRNNFNAMEQQMFEQQKYEQNRRGGSVGPGGGGPGSAAGGSNNGGQSPWGQNGSASGGDGMYEDGSAGGQQQNNNNRGGFHRNNNNNRGGSNGPSDPANAPPANAPTGPKNAGRPGANYRGGGRSAGGNNRGFHPYSRN
ncbi:nuclear polyadenylated rna-binding protein [Ophiostoma piceae UAMH 11346]|uniref:Nuclear polyadenylated rna-binding protein n=1 Tax=Ophiostoma piceae (strain UAMH 11346) TaxID=1262450 RepID=S3BWN5_OPHP1|nr:nuclear polyadenylated rna-binding protein [Ophiostoma piceae UAMH 11346]